MHDSLLFSLVVVLLVGDEHANEGIGERVLNDLSHILQVGVLADLIDDVSLSNANLLPLLHLVIRFHTIGALDEALVAFTVGLERLLELFEAELVEGEFTHGRAIIALLLFLIDTLHRCLITLLILVGEEG